MPLASRITPRDCAHVECSSRSLSHIRHKPGFFHRPEAPAKYIVAETLLPWRSSYAHYCTNMCMTPSCACGWVQPPRLSRAPQPNRPTKRVRIALKTYEDFNRHPKPFEHEGHGRLRNLSHDRVEILKGRLQPTWWRTTGRHVEWPPQSTLHRRYQPPLQLQLQLPPLNLYGPLDCPSLSPLDLLFRWHTPRTLQREGNPTDATQATPSIRAMLFRNHDGLLLLK